MSKIDHTLCIMENNRFESLYHRTMLDLIKETNFSEKDVRCILMVYYKFVLANGPKAKYMNKMQFIFICDIMFGLTDQRIINRLTVLVMDRDKHYVDPISFVELMDIFVSKDLEARMKFVFKIYDEKNVGLLSREVVSKAVENFFKDGDEDEIQEMRTDMVDLIITKFDKDRDGSISFDDYATVVRKQPQLIEFLGNCLPSHADLNIIAHCANLLNHLNGKKLVSDKRKEEKVNEKEDSASDGLHSTVSKMRIAKPAAPTKAQNENTLPKSSNSKS